MSKPELAVVVPTVGRVTLLATLDALEAQPGHELLEVLVVADTHGGLTGDLEQARAHVRDERPDWMHWLEYDAGLHAYGHPQRMCGARSAIAPWIWYGQDDNVAAADAITGILTAIARQTSSRPVFGKVTTYWRDVVWHNPQLQLSDIDADCLVLPRAIAERVTWGLRYEGDFDAAADALRLSDGAVDWLDLVLAIARPEPEHQWWKVSQA
jgi:hypothetical protein